MTHYSVQPRDKISVKGYGLLSLAKNNRNNKQAIFKNCIAFTKCITEINDAQIDNAKDLDVVNSMCNSTNIVNIIHIYLEVYGNITETSQQIP